VTGDVSKKRSCPGRDHTEPFCPTIQLMPEVSSLGLTLVGIENCLAENSALSVFDWALFCCGAGSASASFIGSTKAANEMRSIIFLARIELAP